MIPDPLTSRSSPRIHAIKLEIPFEIFEHDFSNDMFEKLSEICQPDAMLSPEFAASLISHLFSDKSTEALNEDHDKLLHFKTLHVEFPAVLWAMLDNISVQIPFNSPGQESLAEFVAFLLEHPLGQAFWLSNRHNDPENYDEAPITGIGLYARLMRDSIFKSADWILSVMGKAFEVPCECPYPEAEFSFFCECKKPRWNLHIACFWMSVAGIRFFGAIDVYDQNLNPPHTPDMSFRLKGCGHTCEASNSTFSDPRILPQGLLWNGEKSEGVTLTRWLKWRDMLDMIECHGKPDSYYVEAAKNMNKLMWEIEFAEYYEMEGKE